MENATTAAEQAQKLFLTEKLHLAGTMTALHVKAQEKVFDEKRPRFIY